MGEQPGAADLTRWLVANDISAHALGLELQVDPQRIRELAAGHVTRVSVELAAKIEDRTGIGMRRWIPTAKKRAAKGG